MVLTLHWLRSRGRGVAACLEPAGQTTSRPSSRTGWLDAGRSPVRLTMKRKWPTCPHRPSGRAGESDAVQSEASKRPGSSRTRPGAAGPALPLLFFFSFQPDGYFLFSSFPFSFFSFSFLAGWLASSLSFFFLPFIFFSSCWPFSLRFLG